MNGETGQETGNQASNAQGSAGTGVQSPETGTSSLSSALTGKKGATTESATAEPATNGDGAAAGSAGSVASGEELPKWLDQTSDEVKGNKDAIKTLSKFKKLDELSKAYVELEKKLGSSFSIPGKDATPEELAAYRKRLGVPESPEQYGFTQDGEEEKEFAALAHANNMTDAQAKATAVFITTLAEKFATARVEASDRMIGETDKALAKKYGDKYPEKIAHLERAMATYGGADLQNLLSKAGVAGHPLIVEMFMTIGSQLSEPSATRKGGGNGSLQPIRSIEEGGSWSYPK